MFVNSKDNNRDLTLGKNGFFSFVTNYTDEKNIFDISDIEEKTSFNITITKEYYEKENYFNASCRLWKPKNDKIRAICKLNEKITKEGNIKINSFIFPFKEYKVAIISRLKYGFYLEKIEEETAPFLYSDKQEINIEENKQYYDLKFKIEEYNNEVLTLQKKEMDRDINFIDFILEDCNIEGKYLTCKIEKDKIIENLYYNGETFILFFYLPSSLLHIIPSVLDITIKYNIPKKEDVYVGITKLLQNNLEIDSYIPYETNITSISNLISNKFYYYTNTDEYNCMFKKSASKPLLLLCTIINSKDSYLGVNNTEVILNNIHVKYNFRIQPINNSEQFTMEGRNGFIIFIYPTKLDFTKNDSIQIKFYMERTKYIKGIKLNPDSEELVCEDVNGGIKNCLVPKSHFNGKQTGYYYIHYLNQKNGTNIFYEISPILVTLQKEKESDKPEEPNKKNLVGIIAGCVCGGVVLIGIIVFFVVRHIKRKNAAAENNISGKNEIILSDSTNVE